MKRSIVDSFLFTLCVIIIAAIVGYGLAGLFSLFQEPKTSGIRTGGGELGSLTYVCRPIKKCEPRLRG